MEQLSGFQSRSKLPTMSVTPQLLFKAALHTVTNREPPNVLSSTMSPPIPRSTDLTSNFADFSGIYHPACANPYDSLIEACNNDPVGAAPGSYALLDRGQLDGWREGTSSEGGVA